MVESTNIGWRMDRYVELGTISRSDLAGLFGLKGPVYGFQQRSANVPHQRPPFCGVRRELESVMARLCRISNLHVNFYNHRKKHANDSINHEARQKNYSRPYKVLNYRESAKMPSWNPLGISIYHAASIHTYGDVQNEPSQP